MTLPAEQRARLADRLWDSMATHQGMEVFIPPQLQSLLDEGLENLDQAKTTDELRRQSFEPGSARRPSGTWRESATSSQQPSTTSLAVIVRFQSTHHRRLVNGVRG